MVRPRPAVEWTVVATEVEALQLEYSWIKEFDPRFNVKYRDDKSYPSLAVTISEDYPRLQVMRGPKRKGVRYFGPYSHAWAIRETLDLLLRVFPARTCSAGVFKRAAQVGRPCLLGYIGKCSAPCVGRVTQEEHRAIVEDFCDFMAGSSATFLKRLEKQMAEAASTQDYERAARLRDDIGAMRKALEKQTVVLPEGTDADVVGHRRGRARGGGAGLPRPRRPDPRPARLRRGQGRGPHHRRPRRSVPHPGVRRRRRVRGARAPTRAGGGGAGRDRPAQTCPARCSSRRCPPDGDAITTWLCTLRGTNVELRVPRRGDKKALMETVQRNAQQALALHKTKRASDLTARSKALAEIQEALGLEEAPLRIECFDVSNLQGTSVVASMVVFEDGLARKSEYRRFAVRSVEGQDDVASMHEVLSRRFARHLQEEPEVAPDIARDRATASRAGSPTRRTWSSSTAARRRSRRPSGRWTSSASNDVALCGLAKRLEEVWLPGSADPVIMPRTSEGLYLLQRVRDEAHRFAIAYHRQKRSKAMTTSALDDIAGLGETRRKALLRHFGSLKKLKQASVEEVMQVPGVGRRTAEAVIASLQPAATADVAVPAFDPETGEVIA